MNPANISSLRPPRSPNVSRRNSVGEEGEGLGGLPDGTLFGVSRPVETQSRRQRHFSGPDGIRQPSPTPGQIERGPRVFQRSGSWRGVNESEEDLANAAANGPSELSRLGPLDLSSINLGDSSINFLRTNGNLGRSSLPNQSDRAASRNGNYTSLDDEESLRRRLAFFFLDPVQKWHARKQIPYKLLLQFIKIFLVTSQVVIYGQYRYARTKYHTDNQIAFEHLFLKGWDSVREIHAYPPSTGEYAIYKKSTFYEYLNFIGKTFHDLEHLTVNPVFPKEDSFTMCLQRFSDGQIFPNLTWDIKFDTWNPETKCLSIPFSDLGMGFNSSRYLSEHNTTVPWDTLIWMNVNFSVDTVTYASLTPLYGPECFRFNTDIVFDNSDFDGQIPVTLKIDTNRKKCPNPLIITTQKAVTVQVLNYIVIAVCVVSLILCCRALIRAQLLRRRSQKFFFENYGWKLTQAEQLDFLNCWYIMIAVNDVLIIIGCILKEIIETRSSLGDLWDYCSLFLGTGTLLVWIGMLRYLGFFHTYNILILTLKGALPNVLRFLMCASLIYIGFVLCGWLVLGPYNFKFKTILTTSECLFSLINGDDMFATFSSVPANSSTIWTFSRFYLYGFISLFIYVILSLFIAIIMDTYDIIKEYYKEGWPKQRIHDFYQRAAYNPQSGIFRPPPSTEPSDGLATRIKNAFSRSNSLVQSSRNDTEVTDSNSVNA